jgi:DNA-directed RNA polymerase subunit F
MNDCVDDYLIIDLSETTSDYTPISLAEKLLNKIYCPTSKCGFFISKQLERYMRRINHVFSEEELDILVYMYCEEKTPEQTANKFSTLSIEKIEALVEHLKDIQTRNTKDFKIL